MVKDDIPGLGVGEVNAFPTGREDRAKNRLGSPGRRRVCLEMLVQHPGEGDPGVDFQTDVQAKGTNLRRCKQADAKSQRLNMVRAYFPHAPV